MCLYDRITVKAQLDGAWLGSFYASLVHSQAAPRQARYMARLNTILCHWRQLRRKTSRAMRRLVDP
jgi:hypothetical protein